MSGGATSIDDLPVGGSDENVVLQTTENVIVESKVEDVKRQRDADLAAAKPQENEVMDMNEFVSGIQKASASGALSLQHRDVPLDQTSVTRDESVKPNFVPTSTTSDYITEHQTSEEIIRQNAKKQEAESTIDRVLVSTLDLLTKTLNQLPNAKPVQWLTGKSETVLINSNFSCGYYVDRDKLCERLKYHYRINSAYDPCSYPGIQCEFYYDTRGGVQSGRQPSKDEAEHFMKVSFMVFRTGSVLIVGKCTERMLEEIYMFLKAMLENEYHIVGGKLLEEVNDADSIDKKKKVRKKTIIIS